MVDKNKCYDYQEWFYSSFTGFKGFMFNGRNIEYCEHYFGCENTLEKHYYI